jgi:hypothetical protein
MTPRLGGAAVAERSRRQSVDTALACGQRFQPTAALLLEVVAAVDEAVPDEEEEEDDDEDEDEDGFAAAGLSVLAAASRLPFDSVEPLAAARLSVR